MIVSPQEIDQKFAFRISSEYMTKDKKKKGFNAKDMWI